jgi:glycosyltransferase involved in cell wall biosynthesis
LQSVLDQTHQSFELIAIDDGSTDRSFDILADFASRDSRIVAARQDNRGVGVTVNESLERAKNELVVRFDADDLMFPVRLERQIWFMQQHQQISVATSYAWLIDRRGNLLAEAKPTIDIERGTRELNPDRCQYTNCSWPYYSSRCENRSKKEQTFEKFPIKSHSLVPSSR